MLKGVVIFHEFGTNVVNLFKNEEGCIGIKREEDILSGFLSAIINFFDKALGRIAEMKTDKYRIYIEKYHKYVLFMVFEDFETFKQNKSSMYNAIYPAHYRESLFKQKWDILTQFRDFIQKFDVQNEDPCKIDFNPLREKIQQFLTDSELIILETPSE